MKFKNKNVIDCRNKNYFILAFGILLFILTGILIALSVKQDKNDNKNIKYMNDIIEHSDEKIGQKSYVDVKYISSAFAVYDDTTDAYYYVSDGKYYYIVYLKKNKYIEITENDLEDNPYRLKGITRNIGSDVMDIAIDEWNEDLEEGEEPLDRYNFYNIYGDVYLDQTASYSGTASMYNVFAFLTGMVGIIVSVLGIFKVIIFNSNIKRFDSSDIFSIESEMDENEAFFYKNIKLYLTRSFIIMLNSQFKVYKYSDVLWMYPFEQRYNGIRTNKAIKIFTRDGNTSLLANMSCVTKVQKAIYDEVWNSIVEKNPSIVLGYDMEKFKHFNEVRKEIKNSKKNGI